MRYITGEERYLWVLDASKPWHCPSDYWRGILSVHVLEHMTYPGVVTARAGDVPNPAAGRLAASGSAGCPQVRGRLS